jgi:SAM-dependent methyltransferase
VIPWDGTQIVADVGCGNGFDLRQIVPQGRCRHAIGFDLSAGMLRSLEDLRQSGGLSLVQADAQRLPLPDRSVDMAMAMHMLYHVPDVPAAIRELRRITKRDGTVLASGWSKSGIPPLSRAEASGAGDGNRTRTISLGSHTRCPCLACGTLTCAASAGCDEPAHLQERHSRHS